MGVPGRGQSSAKALRQDRDCLAGISGRCSEWETGRILDLAAPCLCMAPSLGCLSAEFMLKLPLRFYHPCRPDVCAPAAGTVLLERQAVMDICGFSA